MLKPRSLTTREILELSGVFADLAQPSPRFLSFHTFPPPPSTEPSPTPNEASGDMLTYWLYALARSSLLNVLATTFACPLSPSMVQKLRTSRVLAFLSERGYGSEDLRNWGRALSLDECVSELKGAFAVLFTRSDGHRVPRTASAYLMTGGDRSAATGWGTVSKSVESIYLTAGLEVANDSDELPADHVSMELQFFQHSAAREAAAWAQADATSALNWRQHQRMFWQSHLRPWAIALCQRIISVNPHPFYEAMACITAHFIMTDPAELTVPSGLAEVDANKETSAIHTEMSCLSIVETEPHLVSAEGERPHARKGRTEELLKEIADAVVEYDEEGVIDLCRTALTEGIDAYTAVMDGLAAGMERVGQLFESKEYFVPQVLACADALYAGLGVLKPFVKPPTEEQVKGQIVIGTIEGDVHDIGKNLVKMMFDVAGFTVHDLGRDVPVDKFVQEQMRTDSEIVALSALMTTSMLGMPEVVKQVRAKNPNVIIMLGGAPLNPALAERYGADGYARTAGTAVDEAIRLLRMLKSKELWKN